MGAQVRPRKGSQHLVAVGRRVPTSLLAPPSPWDSPSFPLSRPAPSARPICPQEKLLAELVSLGSELDAAAARAAAQDMEIHSRRAAAATAAASLAAAQVRFWPAWKHSF